MSTDNASHLEKAQLIVEQMRSTVLSNRMTFSLIRLRILLASEPFEATTVQEVLQRMIRAAVMSDKTFKAWVSGHSDIERDLC